MNRAESRAVLQEERGLDRQGVRRLVFASFSFRKGVGGSECHSPNSTSCIGEDLGERHLLPTSGPQYYGESTLTSAELTCRRESLQTIFIAAATSDILRQHMPAAQYERAVRRLTKPHGSKRLGIWLLPLPSARTGGWKESGPLPLLLRFQICQGVLGIVVVVRSEGRW